MNIEVDVVAGTLSVKGMRSWARTSHGPNWTSAPRRRLQLANDEDDIA
ncbi:MAG: hypothetical protein ACYCPT_05980 [Acidimicrobiales bacterium]